MNPKLLADLAAEALQLLATERHSVVLIPCDYGGGKKRAVESTNPEFYRIFIHRREKPPKKWRDRERYVVLKNAQTRGGYRRLVKKALLRIVNARPHPQRQWIGWELMEILRYLHQKD